MEKEFLITDYKMIYRDRTCTILFFRLIFVVFLLKNPSSASAQDHRILKLEDLIAMAQTISLQSKLASVKMEISTYAYKSFISDLKPQITVYGNVPVYRKEFSTVTQPDGSISFEPVRQMFNSTGVALSQKIPWTGGEVSFNSDLNWFYKLQDKTSLYNGTPFFIRLNQPIFSLNSLKWQKRIEPLKLEESKRTYLQEMNAISVNATNLFFNALEAQIGIEVAKSNLRNTQENYATEKKRITLGTTSESRMTQLELQMLNSRQQLARAQYELQVAFIGIRSLIGSRDSTPFIVAPPEILPVVDIDVERAIELAKRNRAEYIIFRRKEVEAKKDIAAVNAGSKQVNLIASYGVSRADPILKNVYSDPQSQEFFSIGFNVPIVDWGRRKNALRTAKAMEKLTLFNNEVGATNIEQEIMAVIKNIQLLQASISLAKSTDSVALRRHYLSNQLYQIGKLSITDLGISQTEKDNARKDYILILRPFWETWYYLISIVGLTEMKDIQ